MTRRQPKIEIRRKNSKSIEPYGSIVVTARKNPAKLHTLGRTGSPDAAES